MIINYQETSDYRKPKCVIAAKVTVTKKSCNKGTKVGGSTKDIDDSCSCNALHMENRGEVDQEVG